MKPGYYLTTLDATCSLDVAPVWLAFHWSKEQQERVRIVRHALREIQHDTQAFMAALFLVTELKVLVSLPDLGDAADKIPLAIDDGSCARIPASAFGKLMLLETTFRESVPALEVMESDLYITCFEKHSSVKYSTCSLEGL